MSYIDVLIDIPVKFRFRADSPADLTDAYDMAEKEIEEILAELRNIIKDRYPNTKFVSADTMDIDYDEDTYSPYPEEDPHQAVKDLGEWRSAS